MKILLLILAIMTTSYFFKFNEFGDHICGVVYGSRKIHGNLAIWTRDSSDDKINIQIGHIMREKLKLTGIGDRIRYIKHPDVYFIIKINFLLNF